MLTTHNYKLSLLNFKIINILIGKKNYISYNILVKVCDLKHSLVSKIEIQNTINHLNKAFIL